MTSKTDANAEMIASIEKADAWSSIMTGLGMKGRDKQMDLKATWTPMTQIEAEQLYASNDVAKRVVNDIVEESVREWIKFSHEDQSVMDAFDAKFSAINVRQNFETGCKFGRALGGAGLLIVTESSPDRWNLPLVPEQEGDIKSLVYFSKNELYCFMIEEDIGNPRFGQPILYQIQPLSTTTDNLFYVHHSRILRFDGAILPRRQYVQNNYWHDSVLNASEEAIRDYNSAHLYSTQAISDFSIFAMKIKNLAEMIMAGKSGKILERVNLVNMCKAIGRMLILDQDEEVVNISRNVTGLPDLVKGSEDRLVVSTGMPRTKLLMESSKGLGNEGKGEDRTWYDLVTRFQEVNYEPHLDYLIEILERMPKGPTNGKPQQVSYDFKPLWQMSEGEQAEIYGKTATADVAYINAGVLDPTAVARKRFMGEKFNQDLTLEEDDVTVFEPNNETDPELLKSVEGLVPEKLATEKRTDGFHVIRTDTGESLFGKFPDEASSHRRLDVIYSLLRKGKGKKKDGGVKK